jgi:urease accessory protein UreH
MACVHTWGWTITLNPDATTTMRNPSGTKIYHSHSPPTAA